MRKISSVLLTLLVSLSLVGISPSPASAAESNVSLYTVRWGGTWGNWLDLVAFNVRNPDGSALAPGQQVTIMVQSCGNFVTSVTKPARTDGYDVYGVYMTASGESEVKTLAHKIGESATFTIVSNDPNIAPVVWTMDTSKSAFKCSEINAPRLVKSWSVKTGAVRTAKIGKRVKVTATQLTSAGVAARARISYRWRLGTKRVATTRYLRVKKAWRGKPLSMLVLVSAPGQTSIKKVIRYGTVGR